MEIFALHSLNQRNDTYPYKLFFAFVAILRFIRDLFETDISIKKNTRGKEGRKEEHAGNNTMFPVSFSKDRILVPFITTDPLLFSLPLISGLNKLPSYKYLDFQLPRPLFSLSSLSFSRAGAKGSR